MTLMIPQRLEQKLIDQARQRNVSIESLVSEALDWYLKLDPNVLDELVAWQEVRDEAVGVIEESSP
jgi:hypothetical protein